MIMPILMPVSSGGMDMADAPVLAKIFMCACMVAIVAALALVIKSMWDLDVWRVKPWFRKRFRKKGSDDK